MNGIIIVNKPRGFTSHDVVAKLRGILKERKIGHTGTLDPEAEGVLPVCIGNATKVCDFLMDQPKEYVAGVRFGLRTDTQDIFGEIVEERPVSFDEAQLQEAIRSQIGLIEQLTPMYSARKVNGKKLCDLARQGITVDRKTKAVHIYEIELLAFDAKEHTMSIRVRCEKGTYIRTLINDIGELLGCGACMTSLVRTATGGFTLENAHTLEEIQLTRDNEQISTLLIPVDSLFSDVAACEVTEDGFAYLYNGNPLKKRHLLTVNGVLTDTVRVYYNGVFYALYKVKDNGLYYVLQMFPPEKRG